MSRAEASLFLPPCGCVRAGALGSYGNEFCFQGTRPQAPGPHLDRGAASPRPELTEVRCSFIAAPGGRSTPSPRTSRRLPYW